MKKKSLIIYLALIATGVWLRLVFDREPTAAGVDAIGSREGLPEVMKRALDPVDFQPLAPNDPRSRPGETFEHFVTVNADRRPTGVRRKILLQPLGRFPPGRSPDLAIMEECVEVFFGLEVEVLTPLPIEGVIEPRSDPDKPRRQLLTWDVFELLKPRLPDNAFCLVAITMEDIFPGFGYNYVFAQAKVPDRVGVVGFARFDPTFYGQPRGPGDDKLFLLRSCKMLTRGVGRLFGIKPCTHYHCGMNGSSNLRQSDAAPLYLCPVCLRKLHHSVGFDVIERYANLLRFYREQGFEQAASWVAFRLKKLKD